MYTDVFLRKHDVRIAANSDNGDNIPILMSFERSVYADGVNLTNKVCLFASETQLETLRAAIETFQREMATWRAVQRHNAALSELIMLQDSGASDSEIHAADMRLQNAMENVTPNDVDNPAYSSPPQVIEHLA